MSANDPRPAPRRKKLVLRKIADSPARTPSATPTSDSGPQPKAAAPTSSYTGRLSTLRSPSQTPLPRKAHPSLELPLDPESARTLGAPEPVPVPSLRARMEPAHDDVEPETRREYEEVEPEQAEVIADHSAGDPYANKPWAGAADHWWSSEAGALAAMTPAAPNAGGMPLGASADPAWAPVPVQAPAPPTAPPAQGFPVPATRVAARGSYRDSIPRASDAPVVASLPPVGVAPQLEPMPRPRLSADSKLLAAGGALAAAMLLVAVGVLVGQRSSSATAPAAAATVQTPVVEVKAPTAAAPPNRATALEVRPSAPDRPLPAVAKSEAPSSIDVQQLPSAPRPHAQGWSVATPAPKGAASAGWVAAPAVRSTTAAAAADTASQEPSTADSPSSGASTAAATAQEAPAPSASASPPVDPFVQAVREDIREDEARTK